MFLLENELVITELMKRGIEGEQDPAEGVAQGATQPEQVVPKTCFGQLGAGSLGDFWGGSRAGSFWVLLWLPGLSGVDRL